MSLVAGLALAAHPGPSVVVTVVVVGLGISADLAPGQLVVLAAAILLGQLSIGWSNDWIDGRAGRDAQRSDKPSSVGAVRLGQLGAAALVAVAGTVAMSLALGLRPGLVHLLAVGSGWSYNVWLKVTPLSVVPYLLSFGLLPVIVAGVGGGGGPLLGAPWWAIVTAACFGAGVHLANALPDLDVDARTGVRGLPQRLGEARSAAGTVLLLGMGAATVLFGPATSVADAVTVGGTALVALLLAALAVTGLRGRAEVAFKVAMLTGLVVVALLVVRGDALA